MESYLQKTPKDVDELINKFTKNSHIEISLDEYDAEEEKILNVEKDFIYKWFNLYVSVEINGFSVAFKVEFKIQRFRRTNHVEITYDINDRDTYGYVKGDDLYHSRGSMNIEIQNKLFAHILDPEIDRVIKQVTEASFL
jgi:hypothetical protein